MTNHNKAVGSPDEPTITLRSPDELADALPYLMGFHPDDSVVLVAVHGQAGNFGGRVRLGIPEMREDWQSVAHQLVRCLVRGSERRSGRPDAVVVYVCREPGVDSSGQDVMEHLRPLARDVAMACSGLGIPVQEALCLSDGRYWSYVCADSRCCPPEGSPLAVPGTSVMAATATFAGIQVHGSLKEMEARLAPAKDSDTELQARALDAAMATVAPRMLSGTYDRARAEEETLTAARRVMERLREAPPKGGTSAADARDDALLDPDEAAGLLLGLQDRVTRDRAAEWMEGEEGASALRLWRALARRCVGVYDEFAVAPLTLAGWTAWSLGNDAEARVALGRALHVDPHYTFAQLLHQACNEGLDPELVRQCLRRSTESAVRADASGAPSPSSPQGPSATGTLELPPRQADSTQPDQSERPGGTEAHPPTEAPTTPSSEPPADSASRRSATASPPPPCHPAPRTRRTTPGAPITGASIPSRPRPAGRGLRRMRTGARGTGTTSGTARGGGRPHNSQQGTAGSRPDTHPGKQPARRPRTGETSTEDRKTEARRRTDAEES